MRHLAPVLLLVVPSLLPAQDLTAIADTVFARWNSTHGPGCAVGVARGGAVLLTRGYGMADLESGAPITAGTIFESGSVAKQFTAAATVLLALDGKLNLDDDARKYVAELPAYGRPITIRHLLTHTSGLREWSALVALQGWPRGSRAHTQDVLFDVVVRQRSLNYPVGDYYSYTNSGYGLLFTIVERVSGMSFQEFSRTRIFEPLGMAATQWRDDFTRLVPGRAQAYARRQGAWVLNMPFEHVVGPGGLLTTVGDFLTWNEALTNRTLGAVSDSLSRRMRLTSGREIQYALGLMVGSYRGVPQVSHSGSTAGYQTFLVRYPDRDHLSIAVLCNASGINPTALAHALADRLITDFPPAPALDTTAVDPAALEPFAGVYRNTRWHEALTVDRDDLARVRHLPDGSYWSPQGRLVLEAHPSGAARRLGTFQADGDTLWFDYVVPARWAPTAADLAAFVGRYLSDELGTTWNVTIVDDSLTLSAVPGEDLKLAPTYPDAFEGQGTVWFTRDRRGRVTLMHVSQPRLWDLTLTRER
jgi:CubicO group peptidase (beta-lactamase class C family)